MKFVCMAIGLLTLTACATVGCGTPERNLHPQSSPTYVINGDDGEVFEYRTRVEFVLFVDEASEHIDVAAQFLAALDKWSTLIPIEASVEIDTGPKGFNPWNPFASSPSMKHGVIKVHLGSITDYPGILGYFEYKTRELHLNTDELDSDLDLAYTVALHELGHAFGVPHIIGQATPEGETGDVAIPVSERPWEYVMYPGIGEENIGAELSPIAIEIATNFVSRDLIGPNPYGAHHGCFCEEHLDKH